MAARLIALVLAAACLAGCNLVITREPVLTAEPTLSRASLAPGVWVFDDSDCTFDHQAPLAAWPDCAQWFINRDGRLIFSAGSAKDIAYPDGKPVDPTALAPYVLARGRPDVLQIGTVEPSYYMYLGVEPAASDPAGELTRMSFWLVACGSNTPGHRIGMRARAPFRGLYFARRDDPNCTTRSAQVIFNAARRSRGLMDTNNAHWVRALGEADRPLAPTSQPSGVKP